MAGELTDSAEQQFMDWMFALTATDPVAETIEVSLHTSDPGETPDGSTEVGASDYSRFSTGSADWQTFSTGTSSYGYENASEISWGPVNNNWGTISHFGIWYNHDTNAVNYCLWSGALNTSKTVETDDEIRFQIGDLQLEMD